MPFMLCSHVSAHLSLSCAPPPCPPILFALHPPCPPSLLALHPSLRSILRSIPPCPFPRLPLVRYGRKLRLLRRARLLTTVADAEAALAGARIKRLGVYAKATGVVYCAAPIAANASGLQVVICQVTYAGSRRSYFSRAEQGSTRVSSVPFQLALPAGRVAVSLGPPPLPGGIGAQRLMTYGPPTQPRPAAPTSTPDPTADPVPPPATPNCAGGPHGRRAGAAGNGCWT